jgi:hypothetical protein
MEEEEKEIEGERGGDDKTNSLSFYASSICVDLGLHGIRATTKSTFPLFGHLTKQCEEHLTSWNEVHSI